MKKVLFVVMAIVCGSVYVTASPDIKDILSGLASKSGGQNADKTSNILGGLQGIVEGVMSKSNLTEQDLVGNWKYSSPAVVFQSEDLLKKAGGSAAASVIEGKIAPYYQKAGLNKLTAEFKNDNQFAFHLGKIALTGTFAVKDSGDNGNFIFKFKAVGKIPMGNFEGHVEKVGNKLIIVFDASKLIALVNSIAKVSGNQTISAAATLLNSYDGMKIGFKLTSVQ